MFVVKEEHNNVLSAYSFRIGVILNGPSITFDTRNHTLEQHISRCFLFGTKAAA